MMSRAARAIEAKAVAHLFDSVVDGKRTAREASDVLRINLGVIERTVGRLVEQRLGSAADTTRFIPTTRSSGEHGGCSDIMRRRWE